MKHNALILAATLLLHTVVYASNPTQLIRNASTAPSAQALQTLCQQLQGQSLSDLSDSNAGTAFVNAYGKPLNIACSAAAMNKLNNLIAAAEPFTHTAGGPASLNDANNFINAMEAYIQAGGSTDIYLDEYAQAKDIIARENAAAATRGAATNAVEAEVEALAGLFKDPASGAVGTYGGGNSAYNLEVVTTFRNMIPTLSTTSGIGTMLNAPEEWLNQINTLLAAGGGGGGAGASDAAITNFANRFAEPRGSVQDTVARIDAFFQQFETNRLIINPLNIRTLDAACTTLYDTINNYSLAFRQKTLLMDYLNTCVPDGTNRPNQVSGYTFDRNQMSNSENDLVTTIQTLRTAVDTNARRGGAPAPSAPQAQIQNAITAFNATVTAHNAAVEGQQIEATRGVFTTSSAAAPQNYMGASLANIAVQASLCSNIAPSLRTTYTNLAATAARLYETQQALATAAQSTRITPGFTGIQTLVNVNGAAPNNTPTTFDNTHIVAPSASFTPPGTFNVYPAAYPTT